MFELSIINLVADWPWRIRWFVYDFYGIWHKIKWILKDCILGKHCWNGDIEKRCVICGYDMV